jgi:hypothetical protein
MSKDPLHILKELSGVNAVSVLLKDKKRIVLLGDVHTPYEGKGCKKCVDDCFTVKRLVAELCDYHTKTKTEFDFFGELLAPSFDRKKSGKCKHL